MCMCAVQKPHQRMLVLRHQLQQTLRGSCVRNCGFLLRGLLGEPRGIAWEKIATSEGARSHRVLRAAGPRPRLAQRPWPRGGPRSAREGARPSAAGEAAGGLGELGRLQGEGAPCEGGPLPARRGLLRHRHPGRCALDDLRRSALQLPGPPGQAPAGRPSPGVVGRGARGGASSASAARAVQAKQNGTQHRERQRLLRVEELMQNLLNQAVRKGS
mmetsp:Transcript_52465/g.170401  ORF Transcript_52465/g.170401 Transcript_52465/m.170401 type:complete len:215 (-) Transcript_52465:2229-2873(-)